MSITTTATTPIITTATAIFLPTSILSVDKFYWIFLGRGLIATSALLWVGKNNSNSNNNVNNNNVNDDPKL